jgi:hypothetical protein
MFLVRLIAGELDSSQTGSNFYMAYRASIPQRGGHVDDPVPFPQPTTVTLASAMSPANFKIQDRYEQLGSGMNLLASLTSVAKESASIFRIMCERWI